MRSLRVGVLNVERTLLGTAAQLADATTDAAPPARTSGVLPSQRDSDSYGGTN
jgi:hypothetical protein